MPLIMFMTSLKNSVILIYDRWMKQINFYEMSLQKNIPVVDKQMVRFSPSNQTMRN